MEDYRSLLKEAIAEARSSGLEVAANELESTSFAAFTTSSEMLQEQGLAIKRFLKATGGAVPSPVKAKLKACLIETELASTGWRQLVARIRKRFTPA